MKKIFKTITVTLLCGLCLGTTTACMSGNKSECGVDENTARKVVISETNDCPNCPEQPDLPTTPEDPENPKIPEQPKSERKNREGKRRRHHARPYRTNRKIRLLPDKIRIEDENGNIVWTITSEDND